MKKDSKKIFGIFNGLDLIIIAAIIIVGAMVAVKVFSGRSEVLEAETKNTMIEFYIEETPDFIVGHIKEGDLVKDVLQNNILGEVTNVEYGAPIFWANNDKGEILPAAKEGYVSVKVKLNTKGMITNSGLSINSYNYYVNKSMEIRVGNVALYGKLSDMK